MKKEQTKAANPPLISTVSHTLDTQLADRLRTFAFRHRLSESSVIEHALGKLLDSAPEQKIAEMLRKSGASLRRRSIGSKR